MQDMRRRIERADAKLEIAEIIQVSFVAIIDMISFDFLLSRLCVISQRIELESFKHRQL